MNTSRTGLAMAFASLVVVAGTAWALSPEDKCEAAKNQEAGKYAYCRAKAEASAIKQGGVPDFSKCDGNLVNKWAKAESKATLAGTSCVDSIAAGAIESFVTAHTEAVASALDGGVLAACAGLLPGIDPILSASGQTSAYGAESDGAVQAGRALSFTDNGDGTITDENTGLMWEKKDDSTGIHGQNEVYSWSTGGNDLDGAIVTTFLNTLNDVAGGGTSCFAGYCDWRVPNVRELLSLLDFETSSPSISPVFHHEPTCGGCADVTVESCSCTSSSNYWSSTTLASNPSAAWYVNFSDGESYSSSKDVELQVRAVRGGL